KSYRLQFKWASLSAAAGDEKVRLRTTFVDKTTQTQSFQFHITATNSPAWTSASPTSAATWPNVMTPYTLQMGASTLSGQHHTIGLADGSARTMIDTPT